MLPLRPPLKFALLGTFWIIFLLGHFTHVPIPGFSHFLVLGATAALCCFAAYGWGAWPLHFLLREITRAEQILFSVGLGWGILSLCMVGLGIFHGWIPAGAYTLMAIGTGLGMLSLSSRRIVSRDPSLLSTTDRPRMTNSRGDVHYWLWLIFPALLVGSLLALAPPTYYDSLVYHLALPAAYIHAGHWIGWTDLIYSGFPQNLEMLWTFGLLTGLSTLPSVIGWLLALLLLVAIDHWCRRFMDASTGATAVAFLLWMPAFLFLSSGGYVDVGLALYFFLSLYALSLASSDETDGPVVLAGLFAGLAAGIKYTGVVTIGLGVFWILCGRMRVRRAFLFSAAALAVFAPWLIKNVHYFGNPVFPFFYAQGKAALNPWAQGAQGYFRALVEYQPHSFFELPSVLWAAAVNGFQFGKGADVLGDFGWALLIAFLPLLAWRGKQKNAMILRISVYALLFFMSWGMTRPVLRFLLPIAPILAILGAYGWTQGLSTGGKGLRRSAYVILSLLLLSNTWIFFQLADVFKPFRVPLGLQSKEAYLTEKLTYYGAAAFINKNSDPTAEIVVVGDQRSYYYERKVLAWTVFNQNPLVRWADQAASPAALRAELRNHGTLLVVNRNEMERLAVYHALDFSPTGEKNWTDMLHSAPHIYQDRYCDVYAL